tara:strand:- start:162 stop:545 length:384 start_codon:yes stop_codon:yes gene_type:complete
MNFSFYQFLIISTGTVISSEMLLRTPFFSVIKSDIKLIKKIVFVLSSSNISDHWKERVVQVYALKLLKFSLLIPLLLFLILSPLGFALWISSHSLENFISLSLDLWLIFFLAIVSILYLKIRKYNND